MIALPDRYLTTFFRRHYQPRRLLGRRPSTLTQYEVTLAHWDRFAATLPIDQITAERLDAFAAGLLKRESPATVNKNLRQVLAILRFAHAEGKIKTVPRWTKLREPKRAPLAFTREEFARILAVVDLLPDTIAGLPANAWWRSLLLADWYTGARIAALLAVPQTDVLIDQQGLYLRAERQKQHADQFLDLGPDAIESIRSIWSPPRELMWPWPYRVRAAADRFAKICARAGVKLRKGTGSKFHRIRKSTASYLKANGGDPTERLGHSSPMITAAYFDPRIVTDSRQARFMPKP